MICITVLCAIVTKYFSTKLLDNQSNVLVLVSYIVQQIIRMHTSLLSNVKALAQQFPDYSRLMISSLVSLLFQEYILLHQIFSVRVLGLQKHCIA